MNSDSDDDSFQAPSRRSKSTKDELAKLAQDSSDDDSDDELLNGASTFRRPSRSQRKEETKRTKILEQALKTSNQKLEAQARLNQMKRRTVDNSSARELMNSAKRFKTEQQEKQLEVKRQKPKSQEQKERDDAMTDIQDTELTIQLGSRHILSLGDPQKVLSSLEHANEYLDFSLSKLQNNIVAAALVSHKKANSLSDFLSTQRLLRFDKKHLEKLPGPLLSWLFHVAISSVSEYSKDSFETLSSLWKNRNGFSEDGWFLSSKDLPNQLQEWFGVNLETITSATDKSKSAASSTSVSENTLLSFSRWLQLWQLALSQNMVLMDNQETISKCIQSLLITSVDPLFASSQTRADNPLESLQASLEHLIKAAKTLLTEQESDFDEFTSQLAKGIVKIAGRLGPGPTGAVDKDDTKAWICQARLIRSLLVFDNNDCIRFACQLSDHVLAKCFSIDWKDKISSVLTQQWNLSCTPASWKAMASSFAAISELGKKFPHEQDDAMCPAVVEIALMNLQAAVALNLWGTGTEAMIYSAFDQLEKKIEDILSQSKRLALGNPHYLKVDYFCTCLRQYPRLEKRHFPCGETTTEQSTLDSFFKPNKTTVHSTSH